MPNSSRNTKETASPGEITLLLQDIDNPTALRTVLELTYGELQKTAAGYFRRQPPDCSLTATELVHEACSRLLLRRDALPAFHNRKHFFCVAAHTMRWILMDRARRRAAQKRGGGWTRVDFSEAERIGFEHPADLFDFDAALTRLQEFHPLRGQIVELRVYGQWSTRESAHILGITPSEAEQRWALAKRWLRRALTDTSRGPAGWRPKNR